VAHEFRDKLTSDGWVLIPAGAFAPADSMELATYWEDLPVDRYLTERCRFRRFGRCRMAGEDIQWLPPSTFLQSKQYNSVFGGRERSFAPLTSQFIESHVLSRITRTLFETLSPLLGGAADVGVHQLSVSPRSEPTAVVPEGPHRDGFKYITIQLIRLQNIRADSAVSTVLNPHDLSPLFSHRLVHPMECLLIDDERVWHDCSPALADGHGGARRDVMVQTWSLAG